MCSSDLIKPTSWDHVEETEAVRRDREHSENLSSAQIITDGDRKSVVLGKSVDLGGRRIIKKKIALIAEQNLHISHIL